MINTLKGLFESLKKGDKIECKVINKETEEEVESPITGEREIYDVMTQKFVLCLGANKRSEVYIRKREDVRFEEDYFAVDTIFPEKREIRYYY